MRLKSLKSLLVNPAAGGATGEWITRFTTYNPHTPGNGHVYYAGMESVAGQSPRFFVGDTAATQIPAEQISMLFNSSTAIKGSVQGSTVTLHVPFKDIPAARSSGVLYSATAFTATAPASLSGNPAGIFNLVDSTAPFDVRLGNVRRGHAGAAGLVLLAWSPWLAVRPGMRRRQRRRAAAA